MIVLPNMGLVKWDSLSDYFSHEQLAANFEALDNHNHTSGKGVQIPYGGLAEQSVGKENLREGVIDITSSTYRTLRFGDGSYAESSTSTRYFNSTGGLEVNSAVAYTTGLFYLVNADFTATGFTPKLRLRAQCTTQGAAPAVTFTIGLYPVTAVSAGTFTIGTVITGSTIAFASPALNSLSTGVTSDLSLPTDGYYIVGVANTGTSAASSATGLHYQLQLHYV